MAKAVVILLEVVVGKAENEAEEIERAVVEGMAVVDNAAVVLAAAMEIER